MQLRTTSTNNKEVVWLRILKKKKTQQQKLAITFKHMMQSELDHIHAQLHVNISHFMQLWRNSSA